MPEGKNILSLTFEFTVTEMETTDLEGNPVTEELYTISCGDSVCWSLVSDKDGDERQQAFIRLQVEHILNHLQERLVHRATKLGEESYFIAGKQMYSATAKAEGQKFFKQRIRSDEARVRKLLNIRRGQPQRLTKEQKAKLPEQYDALHAKYKEIKERHDEERKKNRGLEHREWQRKWLSIAKDLYRRERQKHLELVADPDPYTSSPSRLAYIALACEKGYEPGYMEKLVSRARKAAKS